MLFRSTTLSVERGMVLDYAKGSLDMQEESGVEELSYFNIIGISKLSNYLKKQFEKRPANGAQTTESNFRVNPKIFNFFLRREQFSRKTGRYERGLGVPRGDIGSESSRIA